LIRTFGPLLAFPISVAPVLIGRRGEFQKKGSRRMRIKLSTFCLLVALAVVSMVPAARADEWNKETRMMVKESLEVPGTILTPGTYIFKLADSQSDRKIVQIYSEDGRGRQKLVTTILAISAYRMETPDKTIVKLEERPSGTPEAIHSWFYPGDNYGWQFVYPKSKRFEIASSPAPVEQVPAVTELPPAPPLETAAAEPVVVTQLEQEPDPVPVLIPDTPEISGSADRSLPETAGYSASELLVGLFLLGLSLLTVIAGRRVREDQTGAGSK
jgi:hypothetical protein